MKRRSNETDVLQTQASRLHHVEVKVLGSTQGGLKKPPLAAQAELCRREIGF